MSIERSAIQEAKRWAHGLLTGSTSLMNLIPRVYVDQVQRQPNGLGQFPYILGTFMSGIDIPGVGVNRVQTQADFQWRIVTEGPPTDDARLAEVIMDSLLQTAVTQLSNGWYFSCRRLMPIDRMEFDSTKTVSYRNIGGHYRCWIYAA